VIKTNGNLISLFEFYSDLDEALEKLKHAEDILNMRLYNFQYEDWQMDFLDAHKKLAVIRNKIDKALHQFEIVVQKHEESYQEESQTLKELLCTT